MSYGRRLGPDAGESWRKWPNEPLQRPDPPGLACRLFSRPAWPLHGPSSQVRRRQSRAILVSVGRPPFDGRFDGSMTGSALAQALHRIRTALVDEVSALPGQSRAYGRPHAHPRTRYEPRYSRTGERLPGSVRVRPDCPRPLRGRCECPPDGSWRPSVGVIRADATAQFAVGVPAERLPDGWPAPTVWVAAVYEQGPDGLWRCRRPTARALEILRGQSVRRWAIAVRLLRGDALASVWGSHGAPPDPARDALAILGRVERWAVEERETEWEWRPRQWWDPPRKANARPLSKSDAQAIAEAAGADTPLQGVDGAATLPPEIEPPVVPPAPIRSPAPDAERSSSHPARSGARSQVGYRISLEPS